MFTGSEACSWLQDLCILLSCGVLVAAAAAGTPLCSSSLFGAMMVLAMLEKLGRWVGAAPALHTGGWAAAVALLMCC